MAAVRYFDVYEPDQVQHQISLLVAQGFVVASQNSRSVTLVKRKQFSIPMLVIGFFLCFIPLFIYLIVYALQSDLVVEIRLIDKPAISGFPVGGHVQVAIQDAGPPPQPWPALQLSPDRAYWWDGASWRPTSNSAPPEAIRHPDGRSWWDGESWRPFHGRRQLPGAS